MHWTDCPLIEQTPGKMSGAPVLRNSRVRPEDLLANLDQGAEWLASAHGLDVADVRGVMEFYERHRGSLPMEFISSERKAAQSRAGAV